MPGALILIDIQTGFDNARWGARNNPGAERNAGALLAHWRSHRAPVFHILHVSTAPGSPLSEAARGTGFKPEVQPREGEPVVRKSVNSAFIGTYLEARLRAAGITRLTVCGLTTPHCVSTTVRMAANLGFGVTLAHDACAAFTANADMGWKPGARAPGPEAAHDMAVAHLHGEFATARATAEILAEAP
ncbi:cysteine hydrolase [Maritimibacter sp. 55A14]|uniref:cysteine hydrolase family protein n=1 Tax=Maritimibacter sp. 55A14 TaxID=2174844 RepID=UPI000D60CA68|nr:cysteine hydrolase family protein [Maritimibacter sp. 55A14]PWE28800.1 cysteine hydrolase [Maritimibacter sp. 55A14]